MRVVGLDLSLTATGIASAGEFGFDAIETVKTPKHKISGHARLDRILTTVDAHVRGASLVVVEGPSFGSQGNALHQIGGLWWMVTQRLWQKGIEYRVASPSQVKKYLTGKGAGVDKVAMALAFPARFPGVSAGNDNEIDAVVLAAIGKRLVGEPVDQVPEAHRAVMSKIRREAA